MEDEKSFFMKWSSSLDNLKAMMHLFGSVVSHSATIG